MKFYKCGDGSILIVDQAVSCCCEKDQKELVPNTTDAAGEKHVPVIAVDGSKVTVTVGAVEHPMLEAHYIQWIELVTENGVLRQHLTPQDQPFAEFKTDAKEVYAREFCNLHGLWKS